MIALVQYLQYSTEYKATEKDINDELITARIILNVLTEQEYI